MSATNEWEEYHLRPTGWELGNRHWDFGPDEIRLVPSDRVETWRFTRHWGSVHSPSAPFALLVWPETGETPSGVTLRKKFGPYPKD